MFLCPHKKEKCSGVDYFFPEIYIRRNKLVWCHCKYIARSFHPLWKEEKKWFSKCLWLYITQQGFCWTFKVSSVTRMMSYFRYHFTLWKGTAINLAVNPARTTSTKKLKTSLYTLWLMRWEGTLFAESRTPLARYPGMSITHKLLCLHLCSPKDMT